MLARSLIATSVFVLALVSLPAQADHKTLSAAERNHHNRCHVPVNGKLAPDHFAQCHKRKAKRKAPKAFVVEGVVVGVDQIGGYIDRKVCDRDKPEKWEEEGRVSEEGRLDRDGFSNGYRIENGYTYGSFYGNAYDMNAVDREPAQNCWTERVEGGKVSYDVYVRSDSGVLYVKRWSSAPEIGARIRVVNPRRVR